MFGPQLRGIAQLNRLKWLPFLFVFLSPSFSYAASREICGDGIDNVLQTGGSANGTKGSCPVGFMDPIYGNGCDRKCPTPDEDDDGYTSNGSLGRAGTTYTDANDNNRFIIPNEYYYLADCGGSPGYQKANTSGGYDACVANSTTPLCEATGSGVCKYIDCSSGNNSSAGTYAAPYLTFGKVAGGSAGSPPSSPFTLTAGSVVYLLGTGTCSTGYSTGGSQVAQVQFTVSGTSSNKITVKRYPGSTAVINVVNMFGFEGSTTSWYKFVDLEFTGSCTGTGNSSPIYLNSGGTDNEIYRCLFRDWNGSSGNNDSMIYANGTNRTNAHHNLFKDWTQGSGACNNPSDGGNVNAIKYLDNPSSGTGSDHRAEFNTGWLTTPATNTLNQGGWFFLKHGPRAADIANGIYIRFNSVTGAPQFLNWPGSKLRAYDNTTSLVPFTIFSAVDQGPVEDNDVQYNSFIDSSNFMWNIPPYTSASQRFTSKYNLFIDNDSSYNTGDSEGIVSVDGYGSDAELSSMVSNGGVVYNNNLYYNPNATLSFCWYCQTSGGHGPAGPAGANYTFAQWQSNTGQDAQSVVENWAPNNYLQATSTNGTDKGRRYGALSGGSNPRPVASKRSSWGRGNTRLPMN